MAAAFDSDPVWRYGKRNKTRFTCSFCKCSFPSNAKRIKCHLAQKLGENIRPCSEVTPRVRDLCLLWLDESNSLSPKLDLGSSSDSKEVDVVQKEEAKIVQIHDDDDNGTIGICKSIIRFFRSSGLPLELVEDPTFGDMFCSIWHFGSRGIPSPKDLHDMEDFMDWD